MSTTTETFSFQGLVRDVWENEGIEELGELTRKVIASIPADRFDDAVFYAMRKAVREVLTQTRGHTSRTMTGARDGGLRPRDPDGPVPGRSRWMDTAGLYLRLLQQPESIGDNRMKQLGDLTRDEVLVCAERRMGHAKANYEMAKRYEVLAQKMAEHEAEIVGDLDQPVLMEVFS